MPVSFTDNSFSVKQALTRAALAFLHEAGAEVQSAVQRASRVDSGQLKGSWQYNIDESSKTVTVGSPLENAIWEEYGTGEYAINEDGRRGGWYVPADKLTPKAKSKMQKRTIDGKEFYFTYGKYPTRAFELSYTATKPKIKRRANEIFKQEMNGR